MEKIKIIGIPGSLRESSFNLMLLRAAQEVAGDRCDVELASMADIPLYNQDTEENHGVPASVKNLQEKIAHCDGLLIATPEYNHSMPGVFKNTVDWLSRPVTEIEHVFKDLPVGMIGATPGGMGTSGAQIAWLPVWKALQTKIFAGSHITLSRAGEAFDEQDNLISPVVQKQLVQYMQLFVDFVKVNKRVQ
jgi:chromate reductase, NAD(P)H dehydrogenase (quinone)